MVRMLKRKNASPRSGHRRRFSLRAKQRRDDTQEPHGVKDADWYDHVYDKAKSYRKHYTKSRYYFIWSVVVDRMMRAGVGRILDLGCGPGQFASLLFDKGVKTYRGVDFSSKSIEMAKERCPSFEFIVADICHSDILDVSDYDCVVALEFLEHVESDTELIQRIRPGVAFFGSVPNFPDKAHARYFKDEKEVHARYHSYFSDLKVDSFLQHRNGKTFFLMEGTKL